MQANTYFCVAAGNIMNVTLLTDVHIISVARGKLVLGSPVPEEREEIQGAE